MKHPQAGLRAKLTWTVLAVLAMAGSLSGIVDDTSKQYIDQAFTQALVTFAVARTLNGVISVAQGTAIAVEPAGVGVNLSVGEILDPINDLIEQFSSVMLVATSSIGLQSILLRMTGSWGVTLALAVVSVLALGALWVPKLTSPSQRFAIRLLVIAIVIRLCVPLFVICTTLVSDAFLVEQRTSAIAALDATRIEVEEFNNDTVAPNQDRSLLEQLGSALTSTLESLDFRQRIEALRDRLSNASEYIVNLIVIFVLQTILLPLAFLWLFVGLLKSLAAHSTKLLEPHS